MFASGRRKAGSAMKQKGGAKTTGQEAGCKPGVREHADLHSSAVQQLEHVRVSERDRELAREYLRSGEFMAELISRTSGNLRSAGERPASQISPPEPFYRLTRSPSNGTRLAPPDS